MHAPIHMVALLLQLPLVVPDTVVTTQQVGVFQAIGIIAHIITALAIFMIAAAFLMGAWYVRNLARKLGSVIDRADQIVARARDRVDQLDALAGVVQSEFESVFLDVAAAVRGVRAGVREAFDHTDGDEHDDDGGGPADAGPARGRRGAHQWHEAYDEDE